MKNQFSALGMAFVLFLCSCNENREKSSDFKVAPSDEAAPSEKVKSVEQSKYHTLRLAKGMAPSSVAGLLLELQAHQVKDGSGFSIVFWAADDGGPKEIPLGEMAVYKPLKEGEHVTIPLASPVAEAWSKDSEGYLLRVRFQLEPGRADGDDPRIQMDWVQGKVDTR